MTYTKLRETRDPNATRIDWAGLVTFSTALFLLVFGLLRGNDEGWGSTLIVALLAGAALLTRRCSSRSRRASRSRCCRCTCSASRHSPASSWRRSGVSASMFALFLYLTFYLQGYLGHDPLEAGLRYLPVHRDQLLRRGGVRCADLARCRRE